MATEKKPAEPTPMPKKKGGAMFPRIGLEEAIGYARKLVSKTHTGPQPEAIVLPGVFGVSSSRGQIRASALKQYALMEGKSTGYSASRLAKDIAAAPPSELPTLYQQACLSPRVFRVLFETFHGDTVSLARVRQQAAQAGVHPDELENCTQYFAESVQFAGLGTMKGDSLELRAASKTERDVDAVEAATAESDSEDGPPVDEPPPAERTVTGETRGSRGEAETGQPSARSVVQVNVTLDSSLDTDKLERQLALLRKYGAI